MDQWPSIGRIVHVIIPAWPSVTPPRPGDEEHIAPAIITRVSPQAENDGQLVNYVIFQDGCSEVRAASGRVYADEAKAREARKTSEEMAAFWPPRI